MLTRLAHLTLRHRWLVLAVTGVAAACNAVALVVPWREWLQARRGRLLVDLWSGGLIGFVAILVFGFMVVVFAAFAIISMNTR